MIIDLKRSIDLRWLFDPVLLFILRWSCSTLHPILQGKVQPRRLNPPLPALRVSPRSVWREKSTLLCLPSYLLSGKMKLFLYFHIWNSALNSIYMGWKFVLQRMYFGLSWVVSSSVSKVRLHKRAAAADRMELNPSARHAHPVLFWIVLVTLHIRQINLYRIKHDQWSYELVEVYCSV